MENVKPWVFDSSVANNFSDYARKHIPNYDQVIDLSVDICKDFSRDSKIVEVGCASGETINRLNREGFTNIYGIDSSQSMIDVCKKEIATYILSDHYPEQLADVDVVLINWTLHFIKDKISYLNRVYDSLKDNGVLVLSEKVSLDSYAIKKYHQFKIKSGVDQKEILEKEQQVKSIMFINDTEWYFKTLRDIGFSKVMIVNSYWCFNTFFAVK